MKRTRIAIGLLLTLVLCALTLVCVGCGDKNENGSGGNKGKKEYVIGVISDPQIVAEREVGDDDYESFLDFNAIGQKMLFISEAILKTAVDRLIERKVDVVLIPGDLTENGSKVGHETVARECARLEAAGIPTFVICGNHDINKEPERYMLTADAKAQGLPIYEEFEDGTCSVSVSGVTPAQFMEIYKDFGYTDAVALDNLETPVSVTVKRDGKDDYVYEEVGTMSYVQDLPGSNYRLIAIDAANYYEKNGHTYYMTYYGSDSNRSAEINGTGYPVMTERLLDWVETQLIASEEAGKTPIVMAHFPINDQMGEVVGQITDGIDNRMNMTEELLVLFADYGVEYTFTGHLHTQHEATYTDFSGATVTDIETGCLTNYPLPMRYIHVGKDGKFTIENEYLNSVKEEYLPDYVNDEAIRQAALGNLQHYALDPFIYDNLLNNFDNRINDDGEYSFFFDLFDMLELDPDDQHPEEIAALAEYCYRDLYRAFMEMPLYEKSANGGMNLESICKKYGVTLPAKAAYEDMGVFQFFIQLLGAFYKYDYASMGISGITYDSAEGTILRYGVYSIFEVLRTSELFTRLHAINPDVAETVVSEAFVRKLYQEGTLDLMCDDFLLNVLTLVNPLLKENTPISLEGLSADAIVELLEALIPSFLPTVNKFIPNLYNAEQGTLFGEPISSLWTIQITEKNGEKVPVMEIYFDTLLEKIVFEKVGAGVLY